MSIAVSCVCHTCKYINDSTSSKHLNISKHQTNTLQDHELRHLLETHANSTEVQLINCKKITDKVVPFIFRLKSLQSVNFRGSTKISDQTVIEAAKKTNRKVMIILPSGTRMDFGLQPLKKRNRQQRTNAQKPPQLKDQKTAKKVSSSLFDSANLAQSPSLNYRTPADIKNISPPQILPSNPFIYGLDISNFLSEQELENGYKKQVEYCLKLLDEEITQDS